MQGFSGGAFAACEGGGLEESLLAPWGVFRVYFRGIGLGRHEDSVCHVEDPPLGVRFEDVDGGLLGGHVQGVGFADCGSLYGVYDASGPSRIIYEKAVMASQSPRGGEPVILPTGSHRWTRRRNVI